MGVALVYWLKKETRNQKVVSSNPGIRYFMENFHINLCCLFEKD